MIGSREELHARLAALPNPTALSVLVLISTFYESRLKEVERDFHRNHISPLRFWPLANLTEAALAEQIRLLHGWLVKPFQFDMEALILLRSLDELLRHHDPQAYCCVPKKGFDEQTYVVRRRNEWLADYFRERSRTVTSEAFRGHSMRTYMPHHVVLPADDDPQVKVLEILEWGGREIRSLLARAIDDRSFKVMLAPLKTDIDYPDRHLMGKTPPPAFVSLRDPTNAADLEREALEVIRDAEQEQATILIFPELAMPPSADAAIRKELGSRRRTHPVLTIYGLCHFDEPAHQPPADINRAVVIGPNGKELHHHDKLAPFGVPDLNSSERLATGNCVTVLESPLGDLMVLICLDFFHHGTPPLIARTTANVFLVPSLSPTIDAHEQEAYRLVANRLAASFVCNRVLTPRPPASSNLSFIVLPRSGSGPRLVRHDPARSKYLIWQLDLKI